MSTVLDKHSAKSMKKCLLYLKTILKHLQLKHNENSGASTRFKNIEALGPTFCF